MLKILSFIIAFAAGSIAFHIYFSLWRKCCKLKVEFIDKFRQIRKKHKHPKYFWIRWRKLGEARSVLSRKYSKLKLKKVCKDCFNFWQEEEEVQRELERELEIMEINRKKHIEEERQKDTLWKNKETILK